MEINKYTLRNEIKSFYGVSFLALISIIECSPLDSYFNRGNII